MIARWRLARRPPPFWLVSDARNDDRIEDLLGAMPAGCGFVFRHYHLAQQQRRKRYEQLAAICRLKGIGIALADTPEVAIRWRADAVYGPPARIGTPRRRILRLATVHDRREMRQALLLRADVLFVSPVHKTRSHPGGQVLGPVRALLLAAATDAPVVMLGGMTAGRASAMQHNGWAAIDGIRRGDLGKPDFRTGVR